MLSVILAAIVGQGGDVVATRIGDPSRVYSLDPSVLAYVPPWARQLEVRVDAKGKLWMSGRIDNGHVWYQPDNWKTLSVEDGAVERNYGVSLGEGRPTPGTLQTGDASLAKALLQPDPTGYAAIAARVGEYHGPGLAGLSLLALVLVLYLNRRKRVRV